MHLHYAIGKLEDRFEDFKSAIQNFDLANELAFELYPACKTFDSEAAGREVHLIENLYSRSFLADLENLDAGDDDPIFIIGMIRSGTTLLDRIVSSSGQVCSVGESPFWVTESDRVGSQWSTAPPNGESLQSLACRYLTAIRANSKTQRFVDKMPLNYRNVGLIHAVFPKAKFLHISRNPADTCFSIYTNFFGGGANFLYRRENIVAAFQYYEALLAHWRTVLPDGCLYELKYEDLVTDTERQIEALLGFLGLSRLQESSEVEAPIFTPSRWQARQPIYRSSVNTWQRYAPFLPEFGFDQTLRRGY